MSWRSITAITVLALSSVSCATSYKSRTAKTLEISSKIVQMPTVVDLKVDERLVSRDTVWTTTPFRRGETLKTQINNLTASLLGSVNADVLVQPSVSHGVTVRKLVRTTHTLSVSGYPAHYCGFRTITADDVKVLDALSDKHDTETRALLADYREAMPKNRLETNITQSKSKSILSAFKPRNVKPVIERTHKYQRKSGYTGMVDFSYLHRGSNYGFEASTTHGYQIGKYFFVGAGVSFLFTDRDYSPISIPVYVDLRGYLLNRRVSPFIEGRAGFAISNDSTNGGYYYSIGLGLNVSHLDIGVSYIEIGRRLEGAAQFRIGVKF